MNELQNEIWNVIGRGSGTHGSLVQRVARLFVEEPELADEIEALLDAIVSGVATRAISNPGGYMVSGMKRICAEHGLQFIESRTHDVIPISCRRA